MATSRAAPVQLVRDPATGLECCPTLEEAARLPAATLDAIHAYLDDQLAAHLEARKEALVAEFRARATAEAERAAAEAERAAAEVERRLATLRRSILRTLRLRGLEPAPDELARLESCQDAERLERWDEAVMETHSAAALLER